MIRRFSIAFATGIALLAAGPASAYWEYGHQTIAQIAMANVKPKTRAAVHRILRQADLLGTPQCKAETIEDASIWPDCIKNIKDADGKRPFDFAYTWHFQDTEICKPYDPVPPCKDGNCVTVQIDRDVALLRDPRTSAHDRVQALAFLIHFVGDLHQPLHASDKEDKGGNDVKVAYGVYDPARLNLHSVWDGLLAERAITSGPSLVRRYAPGEKAKLQAGSVADWAKESWDISRDDIYAKLGGGDPCAAPSGKVQIDEATIDGWVPIARLEVERGGLRLAKLLDRALG
jgi:hypothetical protein